MASPSGELNDLALIKLSLDAHRQEYGELSEIWKQIDTKAQNNVQLAGFLLAALVAFLTKGDQPTVAQRSLLALIAVGLFGTIGACVDALRIRSVEGPPHFGDLQETIEDLLRLVPEETRSSRAADFLRQNIEMWKSSNETTRRTLDAKTQRLSYAQGVILVSALLVMIFVVLRVAS
jgi:hypothetical protein